MDEIRELNDKIVALEKEVSKFEENCMALQDYQSSLLGVCTVWAKWLGNASGSERNPSDSRKDMKNQ